jgi:hypothetical protein
MLAECQAITCGKQGTLLQNQHGIRKWLYPQMASFVPYQVFWQGIKRWR